MALKGYITARNDDGLWYVQSATYARGKCVGVIFCNGEDEALTFDGEDAVRVLTFINDDVNLMYQVYYRAWLEVKP